MKQNSRTSFEKYRNIKWNINLKSIAIRAIITIGMLVGASIIGFIFREMQLLKSDIAIVYLLAVLLTARCTNGYVFGFIASLLAAFSFNFLFSDPYYTFSVNTKSYIITFFIMTITALITSTVTTNAKQNAMKAREKEEETKALYTLTNRLTDAFDTHEIGGNAISTISEMLNCKVGCLCFDENGKPEKTFMQQISPKERILREVTNPKELIWQIERMEGDFYIGSEFYNWPIGGRENMLGIIRVPKEAAQAINGVQRHMLNAMIECTALAMDRFRATRQRLKSNEDMAQERYRGNLLRAISHDLRTPLAGIMGTAEMLLNMTEVQDQRYLLMSDIHKESNWLHSLVENILSLTKLQDGKLILNKQEEAAEEVVGAAIRHISRYFPEHEISVLVPDELLLVPMDATLIGQVLINLLGNAVKHTIPQEEIQVTVMKDIKQGCAIFSICDRGDGIAASDLPNIFQMFYTSRVNHSDAQYGIGLGLTICDAVVRAHGGTIKAGNRADGPGAEFVFTLPLEVN